MEWVRILFEKYRFARRATLIWACWLITVAAFNFFDEEIPISAADATVYTALVGILATVIGFYVKSREREDMRRDIHVDTDTDSR